VTCLWVIYWFVQNRIIVSCKIFGSRLNWSIYFFSFILDYASHCNGWVDNIFDIKQKQSHECSTFYHTQCDFSLVFSQLWEI